MDSIASFQQKMYAYYHEHGRKLPWRATTNPYHILVSEIMLQQTQVKRVIEKYGEFIKKFPDFMALSKASLQDVMKLWQGLGYNRRALHLKKLAEIIIQKHLGNVPASPESLAELPGIGKTTAAAICAFAFNQPGIFIETNIRTVFIHFFFQHKATVHDRELVPLLEKYLDYKNPRIWYYALMDYGAMLKKQHGNPARKSAHHYRQSPFKGSQRELRGKIVKFVTLKPRSEVELYTKFPGDSTNVQKALADLESEGFLVKKGAKFCLA